MTDLTIIHDGQAVTTSLLVAESFDKNHRDVLKAIESLKYGVAQKFADLFVKDSYIHEQNKQEYPMYYMNRDGFTLLAMGFTGKRAMEFKLKYIEAFNQMEQQLKQQVPQNSLELALRAALEHEQSIKQIRSDVDYLKDSMRIDALQQADIKTIAQRSVIQALGGKDSNAYQNKSIRTKTFHELWGGFNRYFKIPRYPDLQKAKYDEALRYINVWRPSTSLQMEIDAVNSQMTMV